MNYIESRFKDCLSNIDLYDGDQYNEGFILLHELYLQLVLSQQNMNKTIKIVFKHRMNPNKTYYAYLDLKDLTIVDSKNTLYSYMKDLISIKLA